MSDKGFSFEALANYNGIFNSDSSPVQSPYTYPLPQPQYCVQNISDSYKSLDHIFKAHEIMDGTVSSVIVRKTQGLELSEHGIWRFRKRDGTYVDIGKIAINNIFIVNPEPDNPYKFDALFFELVVDNDKAPIVIPYKDLIKRKIYPHILLLLGKSDNPDFKPEYANYIIFRLLSSQKNPGNNYNFINLPARAGWIDIEGAHPIFAAYNFIIPELKNYYADGVKNRKLLDVDRSIEEIGREYRQVIPSHWKYKLLAAIRVASILLYFFNKKGIVPDQIFIIGYASKPNAKVLTALLKNSVYDSTAVQKLIESYSQKKIKETLINTNDGIALFDDNSSEDQQAKLNSIMQLLDGDLNEDNGIENNSRHITVVLSRNPANIHDNISATFLTFNEVEAILDVNKVKQLQYLSGHFDSALIRRISCNPIDSIHEINESIEASRCLTKTFSNSQKFNSLRIIYSSAYLLKKFGVLNEKDMNLIEKWLSENNDVNITSALAIGNEFKDIFNKMIHNGHLKLVPQYGPPYFKPDSNMAFDDGVYLNIEPKTFEDSICRRMTLCRRINILKQSLEEIHYINGTNGKMRVIEVGLSEYSKKSIAVISINKNILDDKSKENLIESANSDMYYSSNSLPEYYVPLIADLKQIKFAGMKIDPNSDENYHLYASGITRSGKSSYLLQHALFRAHNGEQVIIFDNSDSFSPQSIERFYSKKADNSSEQYTQRIINQYIDYHYINRDGIPIDLYSLKGCSSNDQKINRLYSILCAAAGISGNAHNQENCLFNAVVKVISRHTEERILSSNIISALEGEDIYLEKIRSKLEPALKMIDYQEEGCINFSHPMQTNSWDDFLKDKKKIIVISFDESMKKNNRLFDMILASLYEYKLSNVTQRFSIIIDELMDQNIEQQGPINKFLSKSAKLNISMLLASQGYSSEDDRLGKIIGHTEIKVFFSPKDDCISDISKTLNGKTPHIEKLVNLEQGECIIKARFYSKSKNKNQLSILYGKTPDFTETSFYEKTNKNCEKESENCDSQSGRNRIRRRLHKNSSTNDSPETKNPSSDNS